MSNSKRGLAVYQKNVQEFLSQYPENGKKVLDAFNTIDPLKVYFGDDCNPDEYLSYAKRYMEAGDDLIVYDRVVEACGRSGISWEDVRAITNEILNSLQ